MASEAVSQFPKEIIDILKNGYSVLLKSEIKDGLFMVKVMKQSPPKLENRYIVSRSEEIRTNGMP